MGKNPQKLQLVFADIWVEMGKQIVDVNTGQVRGAGREGILRSVAIGSCIVVAALNLKEKTGAMAHIMLPGSAGADAADKTRYARDGIDEMLKMLRPAECQKEDIQVCLVGAGNVLKRSDDTICQNNIDSVTRILKEKDIPISASALGGMERKSVFLDVETGCVTFAEAEKEEKVLWQASQLN